MTVLRLTHVLQPITDRADGAEFKLGLDGIESGTGRLIDTAEVEFEGEGIAFRPGDLLFGKLRPYLAKAWVADRDGAAVGDFLVLRPKTAANVRFLMYLLLSDALLSPITASMTGAKMPRTDWDTVKNLRASLPDVREQAATADFLDRETAQIDAMIVAQRELADRLEERKSAMSTSIIWSAEDAGAGSQHVIDPAPRVPKHWHVMRNKWAYRESTELSQTGEEDLLTVSHITGVTLRSEKTVTMTEAESTEGYRIVHHGDLVINTLWGWMGALGVSPVYGIVSPAYGVYRPVRADMDPTFMHHLYRSRPYVCEIQRRSTGIWSSRLRIYPKAFLDLPTVLPPLAEQRQLGGRLARATARADSMIAAANEAIALMQERRAALISAAVSGRIDLAAVEEVAVQEGAM